MVTFTDFAYVGSYLQRFLDGNEFVQYLWTTKAIILTKTIIENPYKILQDFLEKNSLIIAYLIFKGLHNFPQATFSV